MQCPESHLCQNPSYPHLYPQGVVTVNARPWTLPFALSHNFMILLDSTGRRWKYLEEGLVPEIGIEPTTYALRMRRSTN